MEEPEQNKRNKMLKRKANFGSKPAHANIMRGALFVFAIRNIMRDVSWCFDVIKKKINQNKQKKKEIKY